MIDLLTIVAARLTTITAGELFAVPGGGTRLPTIGKHFLPPKRSTDEDDHPFILCRLMRGTEALSDGEIVVRCIGGVTATAGAADPVTDGMAQADRMLELILQMTSARSFSPYKLILPVNWWMGDKEDGVQPSSEYFYTTVDLLFRRAPLSTTRR